MKVVTLPAARNDILAQFLYLIDQEVPHVAEHFIDAVEQTVSRLLNNPEIGIPKKFKNRRLEGLRQWPVEGFEIIQIYYLAAEDTLRIVRVLHGQRDRDRILSKE